MHRFGFRPCFYNKWVVSTNFYPTLLYDDPLMVKLWTHYFIFSLQNSPHNKVVEKCMLIALPINESDTTSWFMAIKNGINTLILQPPKKKKKKKKFTILPRSKVPSETRNPIVIVNVNLTLSLSLSLSGKSS